MVSQITSIDQQVLNNNKEIFVRIVSELTCATSEILIAAAWFTDEELFDILLSRLSNGVNVELIIADNQENEKLDFSLLTAKGATVIKIKNSGYGTMNQKYCIIDGRMALHGSYNWSVNARKNNHESIIATDHKETVESLITNFNNLKERAITLQAGLQPIEDSPAQVTDKEGKENLNAKTAYEKVLDAMIAAEVSSFNRERLRQQGFERSLSNNGDHHILDKALDTLYNGFLNDIDVMEDKKRRLLSKIDEQKVKSISQLKERYNTQIVTLETEAETTKEALSNRLAHLKAEILINEAAVNDLKENKLQPLHQKVAEIEVRIRESLNTFVKPGIKWFELITTSIFAFLLLVYLIVFYASAAYILLYSEEDAIKALKSSSESVSPQVFNPDAFNKAWEHGGMAFLFVCLFVCIPLIFASLERIMTSKIWAKILTYGLGLVLVDSFIAIKIAQSIHAIKSQTEIDPKPWIWSDLWTDTNFYLVFILGAFGILLFKFCFEKLHKMADDRNPDIAQQRNKITTQNLKNDIVKIENEMAVINTDIELKMQETIYKKSQVKISETELENLPMKKVIALEHRKNDLDNKLHVLERTTDIYKSHVENDNIPVSLAALKDRINIFLEGWNDFLHQEYSVTKASEKSALATEVAINWENNKINRNSVDKRIKIQS